MRNEPRGLVSRDEWHKQALAEMTPGEFFGSLAIVVSVLLLTLALLWLAPQPETVHSDSTTEVTR